MQQQEAYDFISERLQMFAMTLNRNNKFIYSKLFTEYVVNTLENTF